MSVRLRDVLGATGVTLVLLVILSPILRPKPGVDTTTPDLVRSRNVWVGMSLYTTDFDGRVPLSRFQKVGAPSSRGYWPVLLIPYGATWKDFRTTGDPDASPYTLCAVTPGLQCDRAGDRDYASAFRTHRGLNVQYLAPIAVCADDERISNPILTDQVADPQRTIFVATSVLGRDATLDDPSVGGTFRVDPPARNLVGGVDTFSPIRPGCTGRDSVNGWRPSTPSSATVYGGVWPWHEKYTKVVVTFMDGQSAAMPVQALTAGSTVLNNWGGVITDRSDYLWDLE